MSCNGCKRTAVVNGSNGSNLKPLHKQLEVNMKRNKEEYCETAKGSHIR